MSCHSTPVTTVWTESTSIVPTTTTIIHTSVISPSAQISTSLTTSCLSFRTSSLPTAQLVATKVKHASQQTEEGLVIRSSTRSTADREKRQIPSGLPSNCVSWTISPILSTAVVTPSTSLDTSTIASTTQTILWVPKETIWGCDGHLSTETASPSAHPSSNGEETTSSPSSSPVSSESTNSTSETETSATTESASPTADSTGESSASTQASTEAGEKIVESAGNGTVLSTTKSSSSTRQWIDETARLNSMASSLSAQGSTGSANLTATLPTFSSPSTSESGVTTTSEVQIAPVALMPTSSSSASAYSSQAPSSHRTHLPTSKSSSAGSGAATQGAMAVDDKEGASKAVSVGATIGGVVGLFALIALLLMAVRWYMRWKRGNKRNTIKMRQSWYPAGYEGPDHIVPVPIEKDYSRKDRSHHSFFSMNGKNAISGGTGLKRKSKRFPGLKVPQLGLPFFPYSKNNQDVIDHEQDQNRTLPPDSAKRLTMPAIFANPLTKMKQGTGFPSLATPWSTRKEEGMNVTPWTEKYEDAPEGIYDGSSVPTRIDQIQRNRNVIPPRSILTRPPGFDGVVGPPKLEYQPAGHMSWGLSRQGQQGELAARPRLEWGHSYAASTVNPNPRVSVMPPLPPSFPHAKPFVPGPTVPPSPTEESVYSLSRLSHNGRESRQSRASTRQSKQSFHDRHSNQLNPSPAGVNRKPSRTSNPDLRSAILARASASAASLGNWSIHSGTSEQSLPPLPDGGFRFDFPLPPTPTRTDTPNVSMPSIPLPQTGSGNRNLIPAPGRKPVPKVPQSSVFEYGDYTRESTAEDGPSRSEVGERDTIRQTANWYEKPLWIWDGQSGPLPRIPTDHGRLDGDGWQSRKSLRWDTGDGVARAL